MLDESQRQVGRDAGLFVLRTMVGMMMVLGHGWPKLANFSAKAANFPDPLGISSGVSLTLAIGAEFFCGLLIVVGLATRLATVPLIITMFVAGFVVNFGQGWSAMELAVVYMSVFLGLLFTGPGNWSVDVLIEDWSGEESAAE